MKHIVYESLREFLSNNKIRRILNEELDDTQYTEFDEEIPSNDKNVKAQLQKPINNKKVKETIDKLDNDPEQEVEKSKTSKIKTVQLPSKRKGFECLAEIEDNDAFDHPGQGLYIWTNKSFLESGKNYFKVGQYGAHGEAKTPDATIASYAGTFVDNIVIVFAIKLDDYLKSAKNINRYKDAHQIEKEVHKRILGKNKGYHMDLGKSTELFAGVSLQDHIKNISAVLTGGEGRLKNFEMRPEQKEAHDKIINWFKTGTQMPLKPQEFLLAAKMRYGKNFTFLNVAKTMGMKNILVLTYKPHVFQSLKNDVNEHEYFEGWNFVEFKNQRNLTPSNKPCQVIVSSAQLAQYKSDDPADDAQKSIQKIRKNVKALSKIPFDMIVADEYHYGTSTANFKDVLKSLHYKYIVYVSGTAMKDIAAGRFDDDQIYTYDYIDEQKKKKAGSKAHKDMPTMELHLMHIDPEALKIGDWYTPEEGFNMAKLITVNSDGKLRNEGAMELLLRQIMGTGYHDQMSPYKLKAGLDHTLWVFDKNVKGIKATAALMRKMPEYQNFDIIEATGNVVTDINEVIERINKAEDQGKRTITMTCYRFKEGVTIPEWNGVIMLDQGKSVEEYLQAIFRSQSPNKEKGKDKCYVFDFNPQRCLQMVYDTCENIDKTGKKSLTETIREFLDNANVLDHFGNKLTQVDFNKVIENFREHGSFAEKFANLRNVNISKIDEDIIDSLDGIIAGKRKKEFDINDQDVETGKTSITKRTPVKGAKVKPTKDQTKKYLQKIATVLSNIPEYLFNSEENEQKVEDILQGKDPELFKEITGISIEDFREWNDKKLLNTVLINRNILNFHDAEKKFLESNPTLEDKDHFFNQHFNMRAEGGPTPSGLVNEMLDKLPKSIWNDPKKTFCDPVMGTGTFLIAIKERLMEGLKKAIPDESKRETYIINNMIFGSDINQSKVNIARKLLDNSDHINKEDSLTKKWNMKFDVTIGNPPFQNQSDTTQKPLWPQFMNLCTDITKDNGYVCLIVPKTWLGAARSTKNIRKGSDVSRVRMKNIVPYNLLYLAIDTPAKYFEVGSDFCYYILHKSLHNNKILTTIEYLDDNEVKITKKQTNDMASIASNQNPLAISIYEKVLNNNMEKLTGDFHNPLGFKGSGHMSKNKTDVYKYKCVSTSAQYKRGEFFYSKVPHPNTRKKKIIYSGSGYASPFYDDGKLGTCHHGHSVFVNDEKEANKLIKFFDSKLIRFIVKIIPKSALAVSIGNIMHKLPRIDKLKQNFTDYDVYTYFNLTQEEIDYVESQIK